MSFRIHALPAEPFAPLFTMSDAELHARDACLVKADNSPGYPCRVSLQDAAVGETLLLTTYEHVPEASPYRARFGIFVRQGVAQAHPDVNEIPLALTTRLLSVRAYDHRHFLRDADVVEGVDLTACLNTMLDDDRNVHVHLHHAKQGCYAACVTRV